MNMRKFFCSLLSAVLFSLILFSGVSIVKVSAEVVQLPSGGHYMTSAETLQFIGDELEVTYFNGSEYVTTTATYQSAYDPSQYGWQEHSESPCGFVANSLWIRYTFNAPTISSSPNYVTVRLNPTYSIFDTDYVYTAFCLSTSGDISSATYQSPNSDWYKGGTILNFANQNQTSSGSGVYSWLGVSSGWNGHHLYIPIVMTSQSSFSAYCQNVQFYGVQPTRNTNGLFEFLVMCPYVASNSSGASGTFTGAVTTASSSGGFDTDLTETNGLISGVISAIGNAVSSVIDGIAGLFVPDDEFLEDWVDGMKTLLSDHLGGLYEAIDLLTDFYDVYLGVTAKQSIHVDTVSVPLAGTSFTLGGWDMPLKVSGLPAVLYDGIAYIVDFLAVMMFLKMCRNKLEIILNPDSEVVQNDN